MNTGEPHVQQLMNYACGEWVAGTGTQAVMHNAVTGEAFAQTSSGGIDFKAMLAYARSKLARAHLTRAQVRHGDIYALSLPDGVADAVVMHQVLHFLAQPALAIREAARVLAPGGKLLVVDFAPHDLEFLREEHAHDRLGFAPGQVAQWMQDAGLNPVQQRDLAPEQQSGSEKLTVSLWLAEQPVTAVAIARKTSAHALQETP